VTWRARVFLTLAHHIAFSTDLSAAEASAIYAQATHDCRLAIN
jgi:hypothetical protein